MTKTITSDLVEAYSFCPRKAFLLLAGEPNPGPHEYVRLSDEQAAASRQARRATLEEAGELPPGGGAADLRASSSARCRDACLTRARWFGWATAPPR
jgi:hypothetical protein